MRDMAESLFGVAVLICIIVAAPFAFLALVWVVTTFSTVVIWTLIIGAIVSLVVGLYALYEN